MSSSGLWGLPMGAINKKSLSERDICTKFITPAIQQAGRDIQTQVREEFSFTKGRVIVRGKTVDRGKVKRVDYLLNHQPNVPIAVIEAKDNNHSISSGMQQALDYADTLDVPFVFSSNGDGFAFHDRTGSSEHVEQEIALDAFPAPATLWQRYCQWKNLDAPKQQIVTQGYYADPGGKTPYYFQQIAINRTIEAVANGQDRVLGLLSLLRSAAESRLASRPQTVALRLHSD